MASEATPTSRLWLALALALVACGGASAHVEVRIETEVGSIDVAIDRTSAPGTAANFLRYVDAGHYDGGRFHRTVTMENQPDDEVKIEVIQASAAEGTREKGFPPIALERTSETGLMHLDGTISMARGTADSATSGFFFCIGDQPELDFGGRRNPDGQGFAAFGRIVRGLDVVRKIQNAPHEAQRLEPPVEILRVYRLEPWGGR